MLQSFPRSGSGECANFFKHVDKQDEAPRLCDPFTSFRRQTQRRPRMLPTRHAASALRLKSTACLSGRESISRLNRLHTWSLGICWRLSRNDCGVVSRWTNGKLIPGLRSIWRISLKGLRTVFAYPRTSCMACWRPLPWARAKAASDAWVLTIRSSISRC